MQEAESPLPVPYLDSGGVAVGMESPTETLDPVSEVDTPAEGRWLGEEAEGDGDDLFRKMVNDFQRAGFV